MKHRLFLAPQIGEREPAFSFLSRLAARYRVPTRDFATDMGLTFAKIIDGEEAEIAKLAKLAHVEPEPLLEWSPVFLGNRVHRFRGHLMHARAIKETVVRGCPDCLREDLERADNTPECAIHLRGDWLFRPATFCAKHNRPFVQLWSEKTKTDRYDISARMAAITPAIVSGELDQPTREPQDFDQWIEKRLMGVPSDLWLDQFSLYPAAHFCELLGRAIWAVEIPKSRKFPPHEAWRWFSMGFKFAKEGEDYIRETLTDLQEMVGEPTAGPKMKFGDLYDRLAFDLTSEEYAPFRSLLRDHILQTWPLGPGDDLMGEPVHERRIHSVLTASRELGIDSRRMRKLLVDGGIVRPLEKGRSDAWELFDAVKSAPFLDSFSALGAARDLQDALNISRYQFDLLRQDGYFPPQLGSADHKPLWDIRGARHFIDKLLTGAEPVYVPMHAWSNLRNATHSLKVRPSVIIRMIEDGKLLRVGKHMGRDGYEAILVTIDEVERLLQRPEAPGVSIDIFARQCGLKDACAGRLVRRGHVPSTEGRNPKTKVPQRFMTPADIDAFNAKFITLRGLAAELDMTWQALRHELAQRGIKPFSPDGADYGAVFERSAVEGLLETKLLDQKPHGDEFPTRG